MNRLVTNPQDASNMEDLNIQNDDISKLPDNRQKVTLLNELGNKLSYVDLDKAENYVDEAMQIARKVSYQPGLVESLRVKAIIRQRRGKSEEALQLLKDAEEISKHPDARNDRVFIMISLGNLFFYQDNYAIALEYYLKSYELAQEAEQIEVMGKINHNIGLIYLKEQNYEEALKYLNQSLQIAQEMKDNKSISVISNNIGQAYYDKGDYEKANTYSNTALEMAKSIEDKQSICFAYQNLGKNELKKGAIEKAITYFKRMMDMAKDFQNKIIIRDAHLYLSQAFAKLEDYKSAFQHRIEYDKLNEELNVLESSRALAKYEFEKQTQRIMILEKLNEELEQFTSNAAHDLKEPIRTITAYSGLILKRLEEKLEPTEMDYLNTISNAGKNLYQLVDALLNYAKAVNNLDLKEVDLNDLLLLVKNNLSITIYEKDAIIESETLPKLITFKGGMMQIFQNLISNAIKYNKRQPHIKIAYKELANEHYFEFKDNGIGIDKKSKNRVFEIFNRLHPRSEYDGSGIGLATCKRIVENMNGQIGVESEVGEGSTFWFKIPKIE